MQVAPSFATVTRLTTLGDKIEYAQQMAFAGLLPDNYRKQPANILYAIEVGAMLGLPPVAAINNIHIIKGKPTMSAGLMQTQTRKAGHRIRVWATKDADGFPVGHCQIIRRDDPDFTFETEFTIRDAVTAQLCKIKDGKPWARSDKNEALNWEKWPRAMAKHRAVAECVRDACPDALMGVTYTHEEMGADVDQEGNFVAYPTDSPEGATVARAAAYQAAQHSTGGDIQDAEIVEPAEQHARLMAEMAEMARILGLPFEQAMMPVARQVHEPDNNAAPQIPAEQVVETLYAATPEQIIRVLGGLRGAIAGRLQGDPKTQEAAQRYIAAGTEQILTVPELFGWEPKATPPPRPEPVGGEDAAQGDGEEAAGEVVEPHRFDSREDDADACSECSAPAHDPIHDPLRGV